MLGQPHPAAADAAGERYAFDKPLNKVYGGKGFADVWLRDHFAWEYKGKHKDLKPHTCRAPLSMQQRLIASQIK
jgi:hypothetical protein